MRFAVYSGFVRKLEESDGREQKPDDNITVVCATCIHIFYDESNKSKEDDYMSYK